MLIGNLTRDPNIRYTPNNTAVCSFAIATNRTWMPADGGEKQEKVEFHNLVAWSKLAEICGQLLHKGDKIYVDGRMQTRKWKADDGADRQITEVVIENMILLHSPGGRVASDEVVTEAESATSEVEPAGDQVEDVKDVADDIPF